MTLATPLCMGGLVVCLFVNTPVTPLNIPIVPLTLIFAVVWTYLALLSGVRVHMVCSVFFVLADICTCTEIG